MQVGSNAPDFTAERSRRPSEAHKAPIACESCHFSSVSGRK
jgi:hypothetical protein